MCGCRKYPYSPHGRSLEIPRGRGVLQAKLLEETYEAKLEFPGGWGGAKQKTPIETFHRGSMDIFWNYTIDSQMPKGRMKRKSDQTSYVCLGYLPWPQVKDALQPPFTA